MSNQMKMKSEKEANALALNQKEDRLLAKTFRTLELENGYSSNLLTLNYRTVKGNYKQLKERVSKIKSNLAPDEIIQLRALEAEGKLKPIVTSFNLNAAMKIAAAARRLKLYPDSATRARTATAQRSHRPDTGKLLSNRPKTTTPGMRGRSNSVTGVFIDAPDEKLGQRRNSIEGGVVIRPQSASTPHHGEPHKEVKGSEKSRPSTSTGIDREKTGVSRVSFKPTTNGYSSHTFADKDAVTASSSRTPQDSKPSFLTDDVVETNLGADIYEERRQELLNEEHLFANTLEGRKNEFLGKVDVYLKENPPVTFHVEPHLRKPLEVPIDEHGHDDETDMGSVHSHSRRRRLRRDFNYNSRTYTTEEEYQERGRALWKDMNKTRYLRIPDDKIDLSGVVTLAKDQMKLFQLLSSSNPTHIAVRKD